MNIGNGEPKEVSRGKKVAGVKSHRTDMMVGIGTGRGGGQAWSGRGALSGETIIIRKVTRITWNWLQKGPLSVERTLGKTKGETGKRKAGTGVLNPRE